MSVINIYMFGEVFEIFKNIFNGTIHYAMKFWSVLSIILIIWVFYHFLVDGEIMVRTGKLPETFVSHKEKIFNSNKFALVTLPNLDNYDVELSIPSGQLLHNTVQGNWGLATDANNSGMTMGVYRDGYSADGSVFKGKSGKIYKRMLEQGPYVIKYSVRKGKKGHDVKVYINEKLIHNIKNEGVPSGDLKVIGTNYANYNDETTGTERGRREIDYVKFIPMEQGKKEGFTTGTASTIVGLQAEHRTKENLRAYFKTVKELCVDDNTNCECKPKPRKLRTAIGNLFDNEWSSFRSMAPLAYYKMNAEIAKGLSAQAAIDKYSSDLTGLKRKDEFYLKKMTRTSSEKLAKALGMSSAKDISPMMMTANQKIACPTWTIPGPYAKPEEAAQRAEPIYAPDPVQKQEQKQVEQDRQQQNEVVSASNSTDNLCPRNCIKPRVLNEYCEKDIIRMVVGGEDKFYRKCDYTCKKRSDKDYLNYDQSGPGNPYDPKRDGCRDTEAHCVGKCNKVLVEVDEMGRDLHSLSNNYTKTAETVDYAKSRLFSTKQTTGLFGVKDNRLGGSKTAYKSDYKPQNPNPKFGPINYDSVWDFTA